MKWITQEKARVDRIACPWLITRFVDLSPEFVFLRHDADWPTITDRTVLDFSNAELGYHSEYCSFEAIIGPLRPRTLHSPNWPSLSTPRLRE